MLLKDVYAITRSPLCNLTSGKWHQMLIWLPDEFMSILQYDGYTFIDATFHIAPAPFVQCLIVMVFNAGTDLYVPCAYILLTSRREDTYINAFHEMIVLMKYRWMPRAITVDFELAFMSAVQQEFTDRVIVGCYFHMKRAIRLVADLEILTLVLITDIDLAIRYIRERNAVPEDKAETWNTSEHSKSLIVGRTNNALERYNRRIGDAFMNAHPNIASFFTVIRAEIEYYASRCHIIRSTGEGVKYIETKFKKKPIDQNYLNLRGLQN
ncbi:hypothetical protein MXB_2412 [Myxobolus squamalis]|nr:hypothetical protein MXB_2412 [Myxobolus squamalis]